MNIILPCLGAGSRFVQKGYTVPKPFLPIKGKTMLEWVIENITEPEDNIYLIIRPEYIDYYMKTSLPQKGNITLIPVAEPTEGAACSVLKAKHFISNETPLIIANCDQWIDYDKAEWRQCRSLLNSFTSLNCNLGIINGYIMSFKSNEEKWSYAEVDEKNKVIKVAEKEVLPGNNATVGVYALRQGRDFCRAAEQMIIENKRVKGEFYVCPVFNEMLNRGWPVYLFPINKMYGLGTPEDYEKNYEKIGVYES